MKKNIYSLIILLGCLLMISSVRSQDINFMQGIPDPMGGQIEQLGQFHDTNRLVICNCLRYFEMAAQELNFILHFSYHA